MTNNTNAATTNICAAPVFADLVVAVEVVEVVVGERELTLDAAIDRLGEIKDAECKLKKEKDPLRKATEATLRRNGLETYATPDGRSATTYERTTNQHPDRVYLAGLLTPAQMALAFPTKPTKGMRVR